MAEIGWHSVAMTGLATTGAATTSLAVTGAHVVPIEGEPFDGTVLITDGRIAALGPAVTVPDGARVLDAGGRWLLPGFIDAHTHLGPARRG